MIKTLRCNPIPANFIKPKHLKLQTQDKQNIIVRWCGANIVIYTSFYLAVSV